MRSGILSQGARQHASAGPSKQQVRDDTATITSVDALAVVSKRMSVPVARVALLKKIVSGKTDGFELPEEAWRVATCVLPSSVDGSRCLETPNLWLSTRRESLRQYLFVSRNARECLLHAHRRPEEALFHSEPHRKVAPTLDGLLQRGSKKKRASMLPASALVCAYLPIVATPPRDFSRTLLENIPVSNLGAGGLTHREPSGPGHRCSSESRLSATSGLRGTCP